MYISLMLNHIRCLSLRVQGGWGSLLKCISLSVIIINVRNVNASIYIMKCTLNDFLSLKGVY